jgi:Ca2+-binding RTX toxin-like protein
VVGVRRTVLLLASVGLAVLLASGVALAATVRCEGGECRGTQKDDNIVGTDRRDVVEALGGDDEVFGRDGNDVFYLQGGNDQARGGPGDDKMLGGDGSDYFVLGGPGDDFISGGQGYDGLMGDRGDDVLKGGSSRDELHGWRGGDTIIGGEGPDYIEPNPWWGYPQEEGQDTEDNVEAGPGNDDIYMGYLDETVDHIDCGDGTDWVWEVPVLDTEDTFVNCENIGD